MKHLIIKLLTTPLSQLGIIGFLFTTTYNAFKSLDLLGEVWLIPTLIIVGIIVVIVILFFYCLLSAFTTGFINKLNEELLKEGEKLAEHVINLRQHSHNFVRYQNKYVVILIILVITGVIAKNHYLGEGKNITKDEPSGIVNPRREAGFKDDGIHEYNNGNYEKAVNLLEEYITEEEKQEKTPDPEALIYLNNAKIGQKPSNTIAVVAPITKNINGAKEILRGVAQAQYEINNSEQENINSKLLKVIIKDDNNDNFTIDKKAQELANNSQILGIIGHYESGITLEAGKIYEDQKIVAISPISTSVKLTENNDKRKKNKKKIYIFRTVPNDSIAAKALAEYMITLNKKKAAIFYNSENEYSNSISSQFEKFLTQKGGQVIEKFDFYDSSFDADRNVKESINNSVEVLALFPNTKQLSNALKVTKANNNW